VTWIFKKKAYDCICQSLFTYLQRVYMSCAQTHSATGPALQAAFMVMSAVGGKLLVFQAASPSVGVGRIKNRDLPALYGTDRHASPDSDLCSAKRDVLQMYPLWSTQGLSP